LPLYAKLFHVDAESKRASESIHQRLARRRWGFGCPMNEEVRMRSSGTSLKRRSVRKNPTCSKRYGLLVEGDLRREGAMQKRPAALAFDEFVAVNAPSA